MSIKKAWTTPSIVDLNKTIIQTGTSGNVFAEYYNLASCTVQPNAANPACGTGTTTAVTLVYTCVVLSTTPSTFGPGNPTASSTFGFGCCGGASIPGAGATSTTVVACS